MSSHGSSRASFPGRGNETSPLRRKPKNIQFEFARDASRSSVPDLVKADEKLWGERRNAQDRRSNWLLAPQ